MTQVKSIIKERKAFYIIFYLIGHGASLLQTGVPNITYLLPPNVLGVTIGFIFGNAIYYASKGVPAYSMIFKVTKYGLISVVIMILYNIIGYLLMFLGIDISVLYGIR